MLELFRNAAGTRADVDFLPAPDARAWVAEGLGEWSARLGASTDEPAGKPRWLTKPPVEKPQDLDALFEHICMVQAEVGQRDVEFALVELEPGGAAKQLPGFTPMGDPEGQLLHTFSRGGDLAIVVVPALMRVPALVHASVARELARIAIHRAGGHLAESDPADHEADCELAAVALGMGIWVANGAYVYEKACCGGGCGVDLKQVRAGLSMPEAVFALALDARRRQLAPKLAAKHLESTQRAAFKAAVACVAKTPDLLVLAAPPADVGGAGRALPARSGEV
jgi:hypothetical protein